MEKVEDGEIVKHIVRFFLSQTWKQVEGWVVRKKQRGVTFLCVHECTFLGCRRTENIQWLLGYLLFLGIR